MCDVFLKQTRLTWWKLAEVTPDFQTGRLDFSNPLTLDGMKGTQSSPWGHWASLQFFTVLLFFSLEISIQGEEADFNVHCSWLWCKYYSHCSNSHFLQHYKHFSPQPVEINSCKLCSSDFCCELKVWSSAVVGLLTLQSDSWRTQCYVISIESESKGLDKFTTAAEYEL